MLEKLSAEELRELFDSKELIWKTDINLIDRPAGSIFRVHTKTSTYLVELTESWPRVIKHRCKFITDLGNNVVEPILRTGGFMTIINQENYLTITSPIEKI